MTGLQTRIIPAEGLEIRAEQEGKEKRISGYGIVYDKETRLYSDLYEVIRPGAASKVLAGNPDIKCALNHDRRYLFGRTKSKTLTLTEDKKGVRYEAIPPDAQWARDAIASIERGDIDGSSFTFAVEPEHEKITKRKDGSYLREIIEISRIGEMGPVTDPAYMDTTAEARAKAEYESLTARLRTQDEADEIAEVKRTLDLRRKRLDLKAKTGGF
jgi:HK97 family phage prohead protease